VKPLTNILLILFLLAGLTPARAGLNNTIYVELGGNGGFYSINYDRLLTTVKKRHSFGIRAGFSWAPLNGTYRNVFFFPVTANYLFGAGTKRLEIGVGATTRFLTDSLRNVDPEVTPAAVIAFRFQQPGSGSHFRAGFTPLFFDNKFQPWLGISFGRSF